MFVFMKHDLSLCSVMEAKLICVMKIEQAEPLGSVFSCILKFDHPYCTEERQWAERRLRRGGIGGVAGGRKW